MIPLWIGHRYVPGDIIYHKHCTWASSRSPSIVYIHMYPRILCSTPSCISPASSLSAELSNLELWCRLSTSGPIRSLQLWIQLFCQGSAPWQASGSYFAGFPFMASFTALMFSLVRAEHDLLGWSEKSLDTLKIVFTLYTVLFETIKCSAMSFTASPALRHAAIFSWTSSIYTFLGTVSSYSWPRPCELKYRYHATYCDLKGSAKKHQ